AHVSLRRNRGDICAIGGRGAASCDYRFVSTLIASVVRPGDGDLVALDSTLELEREEGIFRDGGSPLSREHGPSVMSRDDVLDEPRGNRLALRILALSRFHLVAHQHFYFGRIADHACADFHRVRHVIPRTRQELL